MKAVPQHLIVVGVLLMLIAVLGIGAWIWSSNTLLAAVNEKKQMETQLTGISSRGIFPSRKNLEMMKKQNEDLRDLLDPLENKLRDGLSVFQEVTGEGGRGLAANEWKRQLGSKRDEVISRAEENNVKLPEGFYLGFKRYRTLNPSEDKTLELGVQLQALYMISMAAIKAKVASIEEIKRVMVEDGRTDGDGEALAAQTAKGPENLYTIYPFEVTLRTSPSGMARLINEITESPLFMVIRFVDVENEKTSVPRRTEVTSQQTTGAPEKLIVPIVGQELVKATLRVDLLYWNADKTAADKKETP
ncbi:MAG: hypothetical protein ACFCUX_01895 [Candidatus Methylacidiphilales bacterium]